MYVRIRGYFGLILEVNETQKLLIYIYKYQLKFIYQVYKQVKFMLDEMR